MNEGRGWPLGLMLLFVLLTGSVVSWLWHEGRQAGMTADSPDLQIPARSTANPAWSPLLRVNLTPQPAVEVKVSCAGAYRITPVGSGQLLDRGESLNESTAAATESGIRIGEREFPVTRLEIEPAASGGASEIWLGGHAYRGSLRLFRQPGGKLLAVNAVPLEAYIASVVDSEMPASFPDEARKAQAIVARTYALYQRDFSVQHPFFELYGTTRSQNYLGVKYRAEDGRLLAGETEAGRRVARETAGMVCVHDGKLFCTYYSAVCGGRTTPGDLVFSDAAPPLQSVPCDWCAESPRYRWSQDIGRPELTESLLRLENIQSRRIERIDGIVAAAGSSSAKPAKFQVSDGVRQAEVSADELRRVLPPGTLPSPRFSIIDHGETLTFEGRGHGHGVGLCQWGARGQALAGSTASQIVQHYYPGAAIVRLEAR